MPAEPRHAAKPGKKQNCPCPFPLVTITQEARSVSCPRPSSSTVLSLLSDRVTWLSSASSTTSLKEQPTLAPAQWYQSLTQHPLTSLLRKEKSVEATPEALLPASTCVPTSPTERRSVQWEKSGLRSFKDQCMNLISITYCEVASTSSSVKWG